MTEHAEAHPSFKVDPSRLQTVYETGIRVSAYNGPTLGCFDLAHLDGTSVTRWLTRRPDGGSVTERGMVALLLSISVVDRIYDPPPCTNCGGAAAWRPAHLHS